MEGSSDPGFPDPRAYVQIAAQVRARIVDGHLPAGDPVPTIAAVGQETGRCRQTVSKAMRLLEAEGLLARCPGRGYYVTYAGNPRG